MTVKLLRLSKGVLVVLYLFLNNHKILSQTCNGETFNSPGAPITCTYSYTISGWQDSSGSPTSPPTNLNNSSQSICILADNNSNNFGTIKGTFYIAPGINYSGSINTFNGTLVAEGNVTLSNSPSMSGAALYIHNNSTVSFPSDLIPGGTTTIHNTGKLNVAGDVTIGGHVSVINYPDAEVIVQGNISTNNTFLNCGLLEVVNGDMSAGGQSGLQNLCVTYLHQDLNLNGDFYNDGLLIIDGGINFGANIFYNNDMILANNFVMNNNQMIGNEETSILIVRANAELQSNSSITGHQYYDIDDGGGFDSVCGGCTEDIEILIDVVVPSDINELISACNGNIQFNAPTPKAFIDFDGIDDYIHSPLDLSGSLAGTYMAWIKLDANYVNTGVVLSQGDLEISVIGNTNNVRVQLNSGSLELPVSKALTLNQWTHVAVIYDASLSISEQYKIYINGVLEGASGHTTLNSGLTSSTDPFTIGKVSSSGINYFKGSIDEVRVFNISLTEDQLQQIVYQEIQENAGKVIGKVVPKEIVDFETSETISWSSLIAYYPMTDMISYGKTSDYSTNNFTASMHNITSIQSQTAPMPYQTNADGDWSNQGTWTHGDVWDIEDELNYKSWSIVEIKHDVTTSNRHSTLGLFIDSGKKLTVNGDVELQNNWYLRLEGDIDLEGESQLIQTIDSDLVVGASGKLERDQQGTADTYTYNYWSSPVGTTDSGVTNHSYSISDILKDDNQDINFTSSSYNGSPGTPITLADYWMWKFVNGDEGEYDHWIHVKSTGTMNTGEGFTMKGPGTGAITDEQNYVFSGKPNNGDVNIAIGAGKNYLIGNPYPSALDAYEFINDNSASITGTLYFWEHWGGGSHVYREYQGGYHLLNLSGATTAATQGSNHPDVGTGGTPTKLPGNYIPVSQGFFVLGDTNGGTINFNNGQRIFHKESNGNSTFVEMNDEFSDAEITPGGNNQENTTATSEDTRLKLRIGFNSINTIRRQLLITEDSNATQGVDWGYDGMIQESQIDDMFWLINNQRFTIQGIDVIDNQTILPIGVYTDSDGTNSFALDALTNATAITKVYLHDKVLNIYHNLSEENYNVFLPAGEYLERFEITFSNQNALNINDNFYVNNIEVHYSNNLKSIVIINPLHHDINTIKMMTLLGQTVLEIKDVSNQNYQEIKLNNLSSGAYIIKLNTPNGIVSKKIIVRK